MKAQEAERLKSILEFIELHSKEEPRVKTFQELDQYIVIDLQIYLTKEGASKVDE